MVTELIELQTCAKVLQMHLSESGGTLWLQPKSKVSFNLAPTQLFESLTSGFGFKFFIVVVTELIELQTCAKVLEMHLSESGGTLWLQPKSNATFNLASTQLL